MTSAGMLNRWPGGKVRSRSASNGRTSPMAGVIVERSTPSRQSTTRTSGSPGLGGFPQSLGRRYQFLGAIQADAE